MDQIRDPEILRQAAHLLEDEVLRLSAKLTHAKKRIAELEGRTPDEVQATLKLLEAELNRVSSRHTYTQGSERRPRRKQDNGAKKRDRSGPTPQPKLPVEEIVHDLDEPDKMCPCCGNRMKSFKGQDVVTDIVSVRSLKYVLERHTRKKYHCSCGGAIETAVPKPRLVPGGRYSDEFIVHTAKQKYDAHIPLARQVRLAKQDGLKITSQTLFRNLLALSKVFEPALDRLHNYLLTKDVLLADETRWPLLGIKGRKTTNHTTWALMGGDAVRYFILDSRGNDSGRQVLSGYRGVLVTDGYAVYKSLSKHENYRHAFCWSHCRRYFLAAEESEPQLAKAFIQDIGCLFLIEREIRQRVAEMSDEAAQEITRAIRREKSSKIVGQIGRRAMDVRVLPRSKLAAAIRYLNNHWRGLSMFLEHPQVPMTSNAVERELRGVALGRNNHFGSRSLLGTQVSANLYSLIESAKLNGFTSEEYLLKALDLNHRGQSIPLPHELRAGMSASSIREQSATCGKPTQLSFPHSHAAELLGLGSQSPR